jgi:hypothetical protein
LIGNVAVSDRITLGVKVTAMVQLPLAGTAAPQDGVPAWKLPGTDGDGAVIVPTAIGIAALVLFVSVTWQVAPPQVVAVVPMGTIPKANGVVGEIASVGSKVSSATNAATVAALSDPVSVV